MAVSANVNKTIAFAPASQKKYITLKANWRHVASHVKLVYHINN